MNEFSRESKNQTPMVKEHKKIRNFFLRKLEKERKKERKIEKEIKTCIDSTRNKKMEICDKEEEKEGSKI